MSNAKSFYPPPLHRIARPRAHSCPSAFLPGQYSPPRRYMRSEEVDAFVLTLVDALYTRLAAREKERGECHVLQ